MQHNKHDTQCRLLKFSDYIIYANEGQEGPQIVIIYKNRVEKV